MRNLLTIRRSAFPVSSTEIPDLPLTASVWDPATDSLICVFGPSEAEPVIELKRLDDNGNSSNIASWDVSPSPPCGRVLNLRYFADTLSACVIFAGGDIVVIQENPAPGENAIEIVGSVDEGITAAAWSPDEEVLAITTAASTFLLMTRAFEPITDITFSANDLNASKHVSVGWGNSETQFKGKRAKAMRDPTVPEKVDEGVLSPHDDGRTTISWRGDGAYLAISSVEDSKRRIIRVYSRNGSLDSVSEPVDGLEGALSWRPVGNLMAGIQRFPDKLDVIFFERNGLRHGEFSLRIAPEKVKDEKIFEVLWNGDSSVLAITFRDRIQLWTMANYHWYLKQELFFPNNFRLGEPCMVAEWHPEKSLKLALTLKNQIVKYDFIFSVSGGTSKPTKDYGIVVVVDGENLKLTPLRIANVPPPMAFRDVTIESTPIDVAVSPDGKTIAVLRHSGIDVIRWALGGRRIISEPVLGSRIVDLDIDDQFRQISFLNDDTLGVLCDHIDEESTIMVIKLAETRPIEKSSSVKMPSMARLGVLEGRGFLLENCAGSLSLYSPDTKSETVVQKLPVLCPWFETSVVEGKIITFGLSENGRLYADDLLIASNCTSFAVTNSHLVYTTTQHLLKFIHLCSDTQDIEVPPDDPAGDERCRSIERGARLIQVMPSNFSLTLQMPRGNLETIFPRALVLAGIRRSIEIKDYKTAFLACRTQRVDFNILYDYLPEQFLESIELFIEQVKKIEYIDLFLSQLRDEDVSRIMYRETLPQPEIPQGESEQANDDSIEGKVNRICTSFLDVLLATRLSSNLQNIVTAYVCKIPADLDSALSLIAKLRDDNMELAEQAIQHVCFLLDVNKLYENALGLYDLELTLMVAQQSQKDPREYLPFLQSLQEMEINRRKFFINNHLGRFSKAIIHLYDIGEEAFNEMKDYVVKNELYTMALNLYKYDAEKLKIIMNLFVVFLDNSSRFPEAGLAHEFLEDFRSAIESYRKAGMWREVLFAASQTEFSDSEMDELSLALADSLQEAKDYEAAATIHLEYRDEVAEAARALCKGSHFAEAMRIIGLKRKPELLESVIDVGLVDGFAQTTELIADCKGQLTAQIARLRELRTKKEEDPLSYYDGVTEADAPDNVSLAATNASTSASLFTRYTGKTGGTAQTGATRRTSKNKRREDRKRARGKKGSVYEEEYLVNSIQRLVERLESVMPETQRLLEGMLRRRMRERAVAVQKLFSEVVDMLRACVKEVFEEKTFVVPLVVDGIEQVPEKRVAPVIKGLEKLALL